MFRTLLTPLSARFSLPSPLSARPSSGSEVLSDPDDLDPEDFARDVLVELMRNATERLKTADTLSERIEVLTEIHKIMYQDACTKDVFREMDGFLMLMSVLSTIHPTFSQETTRGESAGTELLEVTRLTFLILSEALHKHNENVEYFKASVGLESFSQATLGLISDARTVKQTMSFLASLALHDFGWSRFFLHTSGVDYEVADHKFQAFSNQLGMIHVPEALWILYDAAILSRRDDPILRYMATKLLERLALHKHRNQCILSSLGLVCSLFQRLCGGAELPKPEKQVVQKLLKRLLDHHVETEDARPMFQSAIRPGDTLDPDVLEVLRAGMKVRWPSHFSLESPAEIRVTRNGTRALPLTGFTFMIWLWIEKIPKDKTHILFSIGTAERNIFSLKIRPDGNLDIQSLGSKEPGILKARLAKGRWTHISLIHYPHRGSKPTIRLFVDGTLADSVQWQYPRGDTDVDRPYIIGDVSPNASLNWCIASAYLVSVPFPDELPRIIHDLGPRYVSRFQATDLIRFLTYEAATALNVHLYARAEQTRASANEVKTLINSFKNGLGISEANIIFAVCPSTTQFENKDTGELRNASLDGDVFISRCNGLDLAMWEVGGAAVALRLVQLAQSPHEMSRALGVLTDGLRNSWQNSEDMEQMQGYDILADILRKKYQLINMTGFETLFEFLGMNFRSPDHSIITNTVAYRAIALDFQLWSRAREEIQLVHLEHFATLLDASRHKRFNIKQRMGKMGIVRKLLFVLQTDWYPNETLPFLLEALKVVAEANFSVDDAIRPIVSYLAANLQEPHGGASSPRSIISRIDSLNAQYKAEQVFKMLVSMMDSPLMFNKFTAALPLTRICLLLLGDRPSPLVATLVLRMISTALGVSTSFSRKFELVSGWNVLKLMLPYGWDQSVQDAAFDILLGRSRDKREIVPTVVCPHIVPIIFSSLRMALDSSRMSEDAEARATAVANVEHLLETLIDTHSTSPTFREVFRSHAVTQSFIDAWKMYSTSVQHSATIDQETVRVLEKLSHLGLSIALDNAVAVNQKQEIMDVLQSAESLLNPRATQETSVDPAAVVGTKSRRRRMASIRLSIQLGESAVKRSIIRIHDWRKSVVITERKRLRKTVLDLREHNRQVASLTEWATVLTTERGLWAKSGVVPRWRLDETEGPYRVRKKLEHDDGMPATKVDHQLIGDVYVEVDAQSVMQLELPPWSESNELTVAVEEDDQLGEEIIDDKHRRVRHELEPGDIIEAIKTVARAVSSTVTYKPSTAGLLIFGKSHIYLLDGLVENDDGEVIDAHDAPRKLFFVPGSIMDLDSHQRAQRWQHDQIMSFSDRTFLFRDVALEIYFRDSRSLLVVFTDRKQRREITGRLSQLISRTNGDPGSAGLARSPFVGRLSSKVASAFSAKMVSGFGSAELSVAQRKWQSREISNFTYLSILNQVSGRTPSDATQYPVFPWVIQDYMSSKLDLSSTHTFRDLSLPMGALTEARREAARSRYENLTSVEEKPFHYGTHFSSSMIVCHFLIRMEPFTHMFKTLQGGDWDLPDRLFIDMKRAYTSAAQDIRGDVRELIPEFFSCPEFLENSANLDFGVLQNTGERIHDVKLPPWAKQDPLLFIAMNRKALESDYVSENLPQWIDLIWGYKQADPESYNVFHPLSYEGAIDLDSITDDLEREATVGIIHNFGQTPRKIFSSPHPSRNMHGNSALPIGIIYGIAEDYHLLTQGHKPLKDLGPEQPVHDLILDLIGQQVIPCPGGTLYVPSRPHEGVSWDSSVGSTGALKVILDRKVSQVVESAFCSCATYADSDTLVTGSTDNMVRLWQITRNDRNREQPVTVQLTHLMRGHTAKVTCITASRSWSLIVSGSQDGSAALWDLNRGAYMRSIWHGTGPSSEVHLVAINESTGYIATCSRDRLWLHTINARPIVSLDLTNAAPSPLYPPVTSMAFLERDYCHTGLLATGAPDGTITFRTWNTDSTLEGEKARWEFVALKTLKVKSENRHRRAIPCVTALKFVGESLYHGEDTGKMFGWELPD